MYVPLEVKGQRLDAPTARVTVVSPLMWALGIKRRSSERPVVLLTTEPPPAREVLNPVLPGAISVHCWVHWIWNHLGSEPLGQWFSTRGSRPRKLLFPKLFTP